jgi:hypothetical protein
MVINFSRGHDVPILRIQVVILAVSEIIKFGLSSQFVTSRYAKPVISPVKHLNNRVQHWFSRFT